MKPLVTLPHGLAVRVYWVDSAAIPGWQYSTKVGDVGRIVTLGYVVNAKQDSITITSSLATDSASIDPLTIPWGCIVRLDELPDEYSRSEGVTEEDIVRAATKKKKSAKA